MTDLEIATSTKIENIKNIAKKLNIKEENLMLYGSDKAKVVMEENSKNGKLILVTAINPTPYGEGKTTVSIGLADALNHLSKKVSLSLRQPSLGPVFGLKGGATGGGYSQVIPMTDINLHFTGDFHALTAANNLISAAIYNHIEQGNELGFDRISFHRCLDVNDRSLRKVKIVSQEREYDDSFAITSASELMALFCLATNLEDLKQRLASIVVGYTKDQKRIRVHDLKLEGALTVLLKDAFYPNLVQTLEGTPAFIHGGPFANIAHGCSSIRATKLALSLSDYVVTEAGFGADLGAEKFLDIVCPIGDMIPDTIVLVATIRALKHHGSGSLQEGLSNLKAHIEHLQNYHVPIVVCINQFKEDSKEEILTVSRFCHSQGVEAYTSTAYFDGGVGAIDLAKAVIKLCEEPNNFQPLVNEKMTIEEKVNCLAKNVYHASTIEYSKESKEKLQQLKKENLNYLPICVAKTQYSISDDSKKIGYPKNTILHVSDIKLYLGAGFVTILLGNIMTMPGLPKHPNYENIDLVDRTITGIF